ncbi:MAG TPA: AAA family ATPase [Mammaliicoccus lentus]|nr:AAA family ATPase [Mammaliicoccus lentus]HJF21122.1 AAA family ATPase [Mammaliicoccus lentus]
MITNLTDINRKSFHQESIVGLKEVNCFFGINGAGKSALANYILDSDKEHAICFDTKFVENNMLVTDSNDSVVTGVKLKISEQVADQNRIYTLNSQIKDFEKSINGNNQKIFQSKNNLYNILNMQLQEARVQFQVNNIHQKPNAELNPVEALNKWLREPKLTTTIELNNVSDINRKINNLQANMNYQRTILSKIAKINFKELKKDLETIVIKPNSQVSQIFIAWISQGLTLHKISENRPAETKKCLFCGNTFNSKDIAKKYFPLIKSEYNRWINRCNNKRSELSSLIDDLTINYPSDGLYLEIKNILKSINKLLEEKIQDTEKSTQIPLDLRSKFNNIVSSINESLQKNTKDYNNFQQIKQKIENYAKSWIGQKLRDNKACSKLKATISNLEKENNNTNSKIEKIRTDIESIKAKQSNLTPFLNLCNHKFKNIGLRLKLEIDSSELGYLIKEINNTPIHVSDLSEGEKRILAFLIFFYKMRNTKDDIKQNIKYIIIDDPITSLDAENSYEIVEMINELIRQIQSISGDIQLFIFTNSSRAFHDIGYFDPKQKIVGRWTISKNENGMSKVTHIENNNFLNRSDYYKQIFQEVARFAFLSRNKVEELNNGLFYCNKTRILIESHAFSNYNITNATSADKNFSSLIHVYNIPDKQKDLFRKDLDIINSNSHGFSNIDNTILEDEYDNISIQKAIRDIIGILNCKDSDHVECMLDSILDRNKRNILKNWSQNWTN